MITHSLVQGSELWHAHRATHFNASDAPAMMGCSPYKTRTQLLHELHTGIAPDVDPSTQRRFDDGHRFETLARPLAEEFIGESLYPVTGSEGKLSASFDGLTMAEDIAFEHKTLNAELKAIMSGDFNSFDLPPQYRVQMEQQCMVSGCEKVLFMASKWDGEDLIEEIHCWYDPDPVLRHAILQGWAQFAIDLEAYKPSEVLPAVVATPSNSLPAVSVRMDGSLTVISNLPDFSTALRAFIERIPAKPSTDQEFADTEAACKSLKKAEEALEAAENNALAGMSSVEEMRRVVADCRELARSTRLASEKMVASRKEQIRSEIVQKGRSDFAEHIAGLNDLFGCAYLATVQPDFAGAIKGKKSIDSLRSAVSDTLAAAKIEVNSTAMTITKNLRTLNEKPDLAFLFADLSALVLKAPDDLAAVVQNRISAHQAKEVARVEADRQRIANEERIKAEAAACARADAEIAQATAAAKAEAARASTEAIAKAQAEAFNNLEKAETVRLCKLNSAMVVEAKPFAPVHVSIPSNRPAEVPMTHPTLKLGAIAERLGFNLTADFISSLGFDPAMRVKSAVLYHECQFKDICAALVDHINSVCALQAA